MKNIARKIIIMLLTVMTIIGSFAGLGIVEAQAATNKTAHGYSMPAEVTVKVGESKTIKVTESSKYVANISWGHTGRDINVKASGGFGSYWGQPAQCTITGVDEGESWMYIGVSIYDKSTKEFIVKEKLECHVTVTAKSVALKSISLNKTSASLTVGKTQTLSVTYNPTNTTASKTVTWSSSNTSVATVSKKGVVTAKKAGTATITAKVGSKTATCKITVKAASNNSKSGSSKSVALKSISLNKTSASLTVGKKQTLSVSYNPTNTTASKSVTWSSSNTSVATVSSKGVVTAKKAGTATITAKVGSKKATCKITVNPTNGSYVDTTDAYTALNKFRTTKGVWYWNSDNKTKTTFNTTSSNKLSKLSRNEALEKAALIRAKEIAKKFSHTRPDGTDCWTCYPKAATWKGENIAMNYVMGASAVMEQWEEADDMYSGQGHRRNMLNSNFNAVGIACYYYNGYYYWVQCFGYIN